MRNYQVSEENRKNRLLKAASDSIDLSPRNRRLAFNRMRESGDWKRATRVIRGIVEEFIKVWLADLDTPLEDTNGGATDERATADPEGQAGGGRPGTDHECGGGGDQGTG